MAKYEHIQWLLEGVEAWNLRRESEEFRPDLAGADIREAFRNARGLGSNEPLPLSGIDLSRAKLKDVNLYRSDLREAKLVYADLRGANLSWSILNDANLIYAKLENTKLYHCELTYANLANTKPWKAVLYPPPNEAAIRRVPASGLEFSIKDVSGLLDECKKLRKYYERYPADDITLYFRGESANSWKLRPSVMRCPKLHASEAEMLTDLMSRRPEEFNRLNSTLAQWVLAQHHELPTRLLDVTRNPLVALFHAVSDDSADQPGRLHVFAMPKSLVKPFNSDTVSVIANFARLSWVEQEVIIGSEVGFHALDYHRSMRRLYHFIRQEKPYFGENINPVDLFNVLVVEPQRLFERIRAQSGAFLISAFYDRFERSEILKQNTGIPVYDYYTLEVPDTKKRCILDELRLLNITRETLFPGIDEAAKAVTQRYSKQPEEGGSQGN